VELPAQGGSLPDAELFMEAPSRAWIDAWTQRWDDLVDFEIVAVHTSEQAAVAIAPRL
jgi:hypothetical protein